MKIILVSYDYPPLNGGIARLCFEIKHNLNVRGIPVVVLTNETTDADCDKNLNVVRVPGNGLKLYYNTFCALKKIQSVEDVVITAKWYPECIAPILAKSRYYVLAHGAEYLDARSAFRIIFWSKFRNIIIRRSKGVIANSHFTRNIVAKSCKGVNVTAIPLCIDSNKFKPSCKKLNNGLLNICSISRLEAFKGHDFIIRTIAKLPKDIRQRIRLSIGGNGPYKESLISFTKELGLQDIVEFKGFIADKDLNNFYSENDLFILCTRSSENSINVEGFGLVFIEAQACGTPVIGTRTGGIPDAVKEGNGGWLIEQDNERELSDLLIKFIDNKEILVNASSKARKRIVEEVSWDNYVDKLLNFINAK